MKKFSFSEMTKWIQENDDTDISEYRITKFSDGTCGLSYKSILRKPNNKWQEVI